MNFANLGYGLNSAVQGFRQGIALGQDVQDYKDKQEIRGIQKQGMVDAEASRQADIKGMVQPGDLVGDDSMPMSSGYKVGGQSFADRGAAEKYASEHVGTAMDYFQKNIGPKVRDQYMAQGDVGKAEAWDKYMGDAQTKRGMRSLAKANLSRMMGDNKGMLSNLMSAVNQSPGMDGYKVEGADPILGEDGSTSGYRLRMKAPDGSVNTRDIPGGEDGLWQIGSTLADPTKQFDAWQSQRAAAAKLRGEASKEVLKANLKTQGEITVENARQPNRVSLERVQQGGRRELAGIRELGDDRRTAVTTDAARDRTLLGLDPTGQHEQGRIEGRIVAMKNKGMTDDQIRAALPGMVGASSTKAADPGAAAYDNRQKTDIGFNNLSPEKQVELSRRDAQTRQAASQSVLGIGVQPGVPSVATPISPLLLDPTTGQAIPLRR